jgi:HD-GYP domain-containing protein (c-di-GMP phosphodiesterase class II)
VRRRRTTAEDREHAKERAKRTYTQGVAATRELMASVRIGGSPNIKKIKRVVQGIVDQILSEETSLIGLTTIRDYDEYTFTHSVNVCIFAVALGKRLGLGKLQLYDLGMAALFHDIGHVCNRFRENNRSSTTSGSSSRTSWLWRAGAVPSAARRARTR